MSQINHGSSLGFFLISIMAFFKGSVGMQLGQFDKRFKVQRGLGLRASQRKRR